MKLWQKKIKINKEIEKYTVGDDYLLDKELVEADVWGSMAHGKMLSRIGILTNQEFKKLKSGLREILKLNQKQKFEIKLEDEDVHTAIENYLTLKFGALGKKIHTARSRNDQILVATRLYTRQKLLEITQEFIKFVRVLLIFAKHQQKVPMPGYTHYQRAMPSSVGLWAGAYLESLLDDFELLKIVYQLNNQSPLGAAAGYGTSLNIDRQLTADLLGFLKVQNNVIYCINSRGKIETQVLFALSQITDDLGKMANDLVIFNTKEFSFFILPQEFCTGSSIMPQKKNPDVLELTRAKAKVMSGYFWQTKELINDLLSGYNRDTQLTKEPLLRGLELSQAMLKIMTLIISKLKVNSKKCRAAFSSEIFATDYAMELVKEGQPFREAYQEVAKGLNQLKKLDPLKNILSKKHLGASGNLGLDKQEKIIRENTRWLETNAKQIGRVINKLVS